MASVSDINGIAHKLYVNDVCDNARHFARCYVDLQRWIKRYETRHLSAAARRKFQGVYCGGVLRIGRDAAYILSKPSFVDNKS